jgi:hypothetical protein
MLDEQAINNECVRGIRSSESKIDEEILARYCDCVARTAVENLSRLDPSAGPRLFLQVRTIMERAYMDCADEI